MADFRKWFIAFAAVALLSSLASAQVTTPLTCNSSPAGVPILRAEGLAELVGDLKIQCSGGTPTPIGQPVPSATIQVFVGGAPGVLNITSRLLDGNPMGTGFIEAEMIVDEPHSVTTLSGFKPNGKTLRLCDSTLTAWKTSVEGICAVTGAGADTYNGDTANPNSAVLTNWNARPNVFLARTATQANSIQFNGIPFDPPGTLVAQRTFRITNVRVNAHAAASLATTLVPTAITMYLSIQTSTGFNVSLPAQTVGLVLPGNQILTGTSAYVAVKANSANKLTQCSTLYNLGSDATLSRPLNADKTYADGQFSVTMKENFAASWKPKNLYQYILNAVPTAISGIPTVTTPIAPGTGYSFLQYSGTTAKYGDSTYSEYNQDVVGAAYNSETGFLYASNTGNQEPTNASQIPQDTTGFASITVDKAAAGSATQGTRLKFDFTNVPTGVSLYVPQVVTLTTTFGGQTTGVAVLVPDADSVTGGGKTPLSSPSLGTIQQVAAGKDGTATYEVLYADWNNIEQLQVQVYISYKSDPANDSPKTDIQSQVAGYFAPTSTVDTASRTAAIPRFYPGGGAVDTFKLSKCSCNILFPYVTTVPTFDTGIAVVNTTRDPWGNIAQQDGKINLYFYNADGLKGGAAVITPVVKSGGLAAFDVFAGDATYTQKGAAWTGFPNFSGYLIAAAEFQYCHGFAYISKLNDPFAGAQAYLGLILDGPVSSRTPFLSETLGQ